MTAPNPPAIALQYNMRSIAFCFFPHESFSCFFFIQGVASNIHTLPKLRSRLVRCIIRVFSRSLSNSPSIHKYCCVPELRFILLCFLSNRNILTASLARTPGSLSVINQSGQSLKDTVVCVFFPFILGIRFVGRTSRGHTGGTSHRVSHPPSFCGACLNFSREKDFAIPFPRRP